MNPSPQLVPASALVGSQYSLASAGHDVRRALRLLRRGRKPSAARLAARLVAARDTIRAAIGRIDQVVEDCSSTRGASR